FHQRRRGGAHGVEPPAVGECGHRGGTLGAGHAVHRRRSPPERGGGACPVVATTARGGWGRGGLVPRGDLLPRGAPDPPLQPAGAGARRGWQRRAAGGTARAVRRQPGVASRARGSPPVRSVPRRPVVATGRETGVDSGGPPWSARRLHPPGWGPRAS